MDVLSRAKARWISPARWCALLAAVALCGCKGDTGPAGPGTPPGPVIGPGDPLPGVVVTITGVKGGSGGGFFRAGDAITIEFTVADDAGQPLDLAALARGAAMVSGPTFNYQRVIGSQSDVLTRAVPLGSGRWSYSFATPIPPTYLPPLNKPAGAAAAAGELTGQPLLSGTYTVGLELRADYTVDGQVLRDSGNATADFLFGDGVPVAPRDVATLANCNQCHAELRAHGDNRNNLTNCLLCHTAGAEDGNDPAVAGGTPGVSIEFKVMIHKLHAGASLPSVLGVTTDPGGARDYAATPAPYQLAGGSGSLHDFSHVQFPVWPSLTAPMPRDTGWDLLGAAEQATEDSIRRGPVACGKCHGDPDGSGPLPAPAQGDVAFRQPSRRACASCHDDWIPSRPYTANNATMPPQTDDSRCILCHTVSGSTLAVEDAHRHPLADPAFATGVVFDLQGVADVGNGNGRFEAGERVRMTFTIQDHAGQPVAPGSLSNAYAVLQGPAENPNLVHYTGLALAGLGAGPTHVVDLPETVVLEPVGVSAAGLQGFNTARAPHWNVAGAMTFLFRRTGAGAATTLAAAAEPFQNFVDVASALGIADGDHVVIEDLGPGPREYARVRLVDVTPQRARLWFSSPYTPTYGSGAAARPTTAGLRNAHGLGATVTVVTLTEIPGTSYLLTPATGAIAETTEFGNGEVLCSYTTDFVVPGSFRGTLHDSPDLDQTSGDWRGLSLLDGTYTLGLYGAVARSVNVLGQVTPYAEGSPPATAPLLFGAATQVTTVARISDPANCQRCHDDVQFHGGNRRGVATCLLCHGLAGAEDAPRYVYPAAAPTPGVTVDFRTMLHKIHHGRELTAGSGYVVVGFGGASHTYETVGFPAMPGGTKDCRVCHGEGNTAWIVPADRVHPAATLATRSWRAACGSCHDASATGAHIDVNTTPSGAESCAVCHGPDGPVPVEVAHTVR